MNKEEEEFLKKEAERRRLKYDDECNPAYIEACKHYFNHSSSIIREDAEKFFGFPKDDDISDMLKDPDFFYDVDMQAEKARWAQEGRDKIRFAARERGLPEHAKLADILSHDLDKEKKWRASEEKRRNASGQDEKQK
jgi:hypothetical protein